MIQLVVREMTTLVRVYVREHFVCVSILHGSRCIPTTSPLAVGQVCSLNYVRTVIRDQADDSHVILISRVHDS